MDNWLGIAIRLCSCGALLLASIGCWQEVHYKPDKPTVVTPVANDHPEGAAASNPEDSRTENSAVKDPGEQAGEVTPEELFSGPAVAAPTETVASHGNSANDPEQIAGGPGELEPQGHIDTPADFTIDEPSTSDNLEPSVDTDEVSANQAVSESDSYTGAPDVMRPSRTALAVWRMSSQWSFAAAVYAKGQPEDRYRDSLEQATYAAELVGVDLPPFPVSEGIALETAVIGYLLDAGPAAFVNKLSEDYVPEYESLAELAIRTNALLLVYTPKSQQLDPLISSIRQSAEKSGLPVELWSDLISMLERREPFAEVKQRVISFHTEVADHLAGDE